MEDYLRKVSPKVKKRKIIEMLFILFVIFTLILPLAIFNKLIYVFILGFTIVDIIRNRNVRIVTVAPFLIMGIFFYGVGVSLFNEHNRELMIQFAIFPFFLLLIYPVIYYKVNLEYISKVGGIFLIVFTIFLFIHVFLKINLLGGDIIFEILKKYSNIALGHRSFNTEGASPLKMVHLGAYIFAFIPLCICVRDLFFYRISKSKILMSILLFLVLLFSRTRAPIIVFICVFSVFLLLKSKWSIKIILLFIYTFLGIFLVYYLMSKTELFSAKEASNIVKIGHINSFIKNLTINKFIFGNGLASYYFSEGSNGYKAHTEITILDMFRYFGFFMNSFLYLILVFPIIKINNFNNNNIQNTVIFLSYIVMSFTNPIFFNAIGGIVIIWYWSSLVFNSKEREIMNE